MAESSRQSSSQRDAVRRVREAQSFAVQLPVVGRVRLPRPEQLAFYGALGVLAAVEIIEWPVALVLATGHLLVHEEQNRIAQKIVAEVGDDD
ncbi:hypothetical protein ACNUDN_27110 [Mycobacterium sp. smrl_JER01]|uniref:hypothetical protein n=1 Tax=Mycobacterium sp. smrl_JER01 TaxID=3402633 RepID=UPI003AC5BC85